MISLIFILGMIFVFRKTILLNWSVWILFDSKIYLIILQTFLSFLNRILVNKKEIFFFLFGTIFLELFLDLINFSGVYKLVAKRGVM